MAVTTLGVVAALAFIALRTQGNARRTLEQERGYVQITELTQDGYTEWHARQIPLPVDPKDPSRRLKWFAGTYADPSKPPFVVTIKNIGTPRQPWGADAKKPAAIFTDGRRHELKQYQAVVAEAINAVTAVRFGGPRSILEAIVAAANAEIEFGDKRYELGERGLANCRELSKRAEEAVKR